MSSTTAFSALLAAAQPHDDTLRFHVGDDWLQGRTAFGGLQVAMVLTAMRRLVPETIPLRVLQTTFVGPVPAGAVTVRARVLRRGKSVTHALAEIEVDGAVACIVVGVFGSARASTLAINESQYPELPAAETLRDMPLVDGLTPRFLQHTAQRWARSTPPFTGAPDAHSSIYVRLDEPVRGEAHLVALADVIPTPALSMLTQPAPASSLTWTLEILRSDFAETSATPGWWLMDAEVSYGADGYLSQSALLWDAQRRPVALSGQTVTVFG